MRYGERLANYAREIKGGLAKDKLTGPQRRRLKHKENHEAARTLPRTIEVLYKSGRTRTVVVPKGEDPEPYLTKYARNDKVKSAVLVPLG
jgi:hypothetical protein